MSGPLLCCLLVAWATASLAAQRSVEAGTPPLRTLNPAGHDAPSQAWSSARDQDGSIWLAISDAALHRYDGATWTRVVAPAVVRALASAPDGTIYWSCFGSFGRIVHDPGPAWHLEPLLEWLPEAQRAQLGDLKRSTILAGKVAFQSSGCTVLLDPANHTATRWSTDPHGDSYQALGTVDGALYAARTRSGLESLTPEGSWASVPRTAAESMTPPIACVEWRGELLTVDSAGRIAAESGGLLDLSEQLPHLVVLDALADHDRLLLATAGHGLLEVDPNRRGLRRRLTRGEGLPSDRVHSLRLDEDGTVWLSTNRGTTVVDLHSPWSRFGTDQGIRGRPLAIARHDGILHVGTDEGLFHLLPARSPREPARFVTDPHHPIGCWDLLPFDDLLIACTPPNVVALRGGETVAVLLEKSVTRAARSRIDPDVVFVGGSDGLFRIRRNGDDWDPAVPIELDCGPIGALETAPDGTLWVGAGAGRLLAVLHAETEDRPQTRSWSPPNPWRLMPMAGAGDLELLCDDRLFALRPGAPTDRPFTEAFAEARRGLPRGSHELHIGASHASGRVLLADRRALWLLDSAGRTTSLRRDIDSPGAPQQVYCDTDPDALVAWLARDNEVLRVEVDRIEAVTPEARPAVEIEIDPANGLWSSGRTSVRLRIAPSRPGVARPAAARARIESIDSHFPGWQTNGRFAWQRVPPGAHLIDIEVATADGSQILAWQEPFHIPRSFWHRPLAWLFAALGIAALAFLATRFAATRLRRRNAALEQEVARRTEQMEAQRKAAEQAAAWLSTTFHRCPAPLWDIDGSAVRAALDEVVESAAMPLRNHLEAHPDQMMRLVELTHLNDVNEAALQLVGATDRATLQDRIAHLFTNDTLAMMSRVFHRLAAGNTSISDHCSLKAFDGRVVHVRLELAVPPGYERDWKRMILALLDQTSEVRTAEERRTLEARTHDLSKLEGLGRLAGGVAHDFNNLLTAISGNLDALNTFVPALPETREATESIELAVRRGADLCEQLLSFSGRGVQRIEEVDLSEITAEMSRVLGKSIPDTATISLQLDPELPRFKADATRLRQVLLNLIVNAAEALHDDGGAIVLRTGVQRLTAPRAVSLGAHVPPGTYVVLEVIDDGIGISEDGMKHIIDPFFSTKGLGRGLGMAAVVGNVHAHGGFLEIDSEPGDGTHIRVWLPLEPAGPATGPQSTTAPASTARPTQPAVLVVDADAAVGRTAVRLLRALHVEAEQAETWQEAQEKMLGEPGHWNVVLLEEDVWLAERPDLAEAAWSTPRPAFLVSGSSVPNHDPAPIAGAARVSKPFSGRALAETARSAWAERQRHDTPTTT